MGFRKDFGFKFWIQKQYYKLRFICKYIRDWILIVPDYDQEYLCIFWEYYTSHGYQVMFCWNFEKKEWEQIA